MQHPTEQPGWVSESMDDFPFLCQDTSPHTLRKKERKKEEDD